jgi:hypothetical protein
MNTKLKADLIRYLGKLATEWELTNITISFRHATLPLALKRKSSVRLTTETLASLVGLLMPASAPEEEEYLIYLRLVGSASGTNYTLTVGHFDSKPSVDWLKPLPSPTEQEV